MPPLPDMWMVTVTYVDGSAKTFQAQDLDDFHYKMVPYIRNSETQSVMSSVLINR